MDVQKLKYFLAVADAQSFTKAARQSYISHNAIMKHINSLEQELGVPLFERKRTGVYLNKAGESFYEDAQRLLSLENEIVEKTHAAYNDSLSVIRIGSSLIRTHLPLLDIWDNITFMFPRMQFRIIPFDDPTSDTYGRHEFFDVLGQDYDIVACIFSTNLWNDRCKALELWKVPIRLGVPITHPLAHKKKLSVSDLAGSTLILAPRGNTGPIDQLRNEIEKHPEIHVLDGLTYIDTFNTCAQNNYLMTVFDIWKGVHPSILIKEVDWDYALPYGLIYAKHPTPGVRRFIEGVKTLLPVK